MRVKYCYSRKKDWGITRWKRFDNHKIPKAAHRKLSLVSVRWCYRTSRAIWIQQTETKLRESHFTWPTWTRISWWNVSSIRQVVWKNERGDIVIICFNCFDLTFCRSTLARAVDRIVWMATASLTSTSKMKEGWWWVGPTNIVCMLRSCHHMQNRKWLSII